MITLDKLTRMVSFWESLAAQMREQEEAMEPSWLRDDVAEARQGAEREADALRKLSAVLAVDE